MTPTESNQNSTTGHATIAQTPAAYGYLNTTPAHRTEVECHRLHTERVAREAVAKQDSR